MNWNIMEKRISCRSYQNQVLSQELLDKLKAFTAELNQESGLHMELIHTPEAVLKLAGAMFSGTVHTYLVLAGKDNALTAEQLGYYGEKFVLYATALGLGTCWVAGTYDKKSVRTELADGEKIHSVIPVGIPSEEIPSKQKMIRSMLRKRDRSPEAFLESETAFADVPEWIQNGIRAVLLAPSAVNQQPVNLVYHDDRIFMKIWKNGHGMRFIDMGIAKYHFELGASLTGTQGCFQSGDNGEFIRI